LIGIQIYYSSTAGYAGIRLGALSSDQSITQFIMNGGLATNYCIHADAGALTLTMSDSHPYNASINVMKFAGAGTSCGFSNVVFDRALADTVDITSMTTSVFTGCYFQASVNGFSNVKLTTCDGVDFVSCHWDGAAGSVSCVETDAGSSNISVQNGAVASIGNYTTPFDLLGTYSYARGIAGFNPFGMAFSPAFCSAAAQAQNTTNYLGPNGINTTEINSVYVVPQDVKILSAYCIADTTPAVGQTFTFTVRVDGADVGTPLVVNNGSFGGVITCAVDASQYQRICIKSVFSATSGAASIRGLINFSA
jgi:hypothetical protein